MRDWILGLQKAAIEHRSGLPPDAWADAERETGTEAPDELKDLYAHMNGATFASGVVLFPLRGTGEVKGMVEQNRSGAAGLPAQDVWRFGRKDTEHLAAVRKRRITEIEQAEGNAPPDWLESAPDEAWIFVARDEASNGLRVYPKLESLLTSRIPPADAEDFGDRTYARALSLVESALSEIGTTAAGGVAKTRIAVGGLVQKAKKAIAAKAKTARAAKAKGTSGKSGTGKASVQRGATKSAAPKRGATKRGPATSAAKKEATKRRAPIKRAAAKRGAATKPRRAGKGTAAAPKKSRR